MEELIKPDDARALLQSAQSLRTHWSGTITRHLGYAVTITAAIWSYFLKSYVDSLSQQPLGQPSYIVLAAGVSSALLGLWRLYTHYIDDELMSRGV